MIDVLPTNKFLHSLVERCKRQSHISTAYRHLVVLRDGLRKLFGPCGSVIIIELDSLWPWRPNEPLICCSTCFSRCGADAQVPDTILLCSIANNWSSTICEVNCCFKKLVSLLSKVSVVSWGGLSFELLSWSVNYACALFSTGFVKNFVKYYFESDRLCNHVLKYFFLS